VKRAGSRRLDMSLSLGKAWEYAVHPQDGEEALLERGDSSQVACIWWIGVVWDGWRSTGSFVWFSGVCGK